MTTKTCKNCKYLDKSYCDHVQWDDPDYPHNNSKGFGIEASALDDTDMSVALRVDDDFGCLKFKEGQNNDKN